MLDRSIGWGWQKGGIHFASVICSAYLASTAGFKLQLPDLSKQVLAEEALATRRAIPSVGQTFVQEDIWQLKDT